ncbi:MAG: phosphoglycerate mutase family protein, partial [Chloroflexota bacterium]
MALTTISFVRHGEVYNPNKIFYGRLPRFGLSDLGCEQAIAAGDYLDSSLPPVA